MEIDADIMALYQAHTAIIEPESENIKAPEPAPEADIVVTVEAIPVHQEVKVKRQRTLVKPERERINVNHPQYHYRKRAQLQAAQINPSNTGNGPTISPKLTKLGRGTSILGREEKASPHDRSNIESDTSSIRSHDAGQLKPRFDAWKLYCKLITCCFPTPFLVLIGKKDPASQSAWREKISFISCILVIMGMVGFLTFGFTEIVCPTPPLSFHVSELNNGYVSIDGWAYMLASWTDHPPIPGMTNAASNIMYEPVSAGGKDATFLFQNVNQHCLDVINPKPGTNVGQQGNQVQAYFPCQLFDPNSSVVPDSAAFNNQTGCHFSSAARQMYQSFQTQGVPKLTGGYDKAGRIYYNWKEVADSNHLLIYNGDVLNIGLLKSLPRNLFDIPQGGLIDTLLSNATEYIGTDVSYLATGYRSPNGVSWKKEADCLSDVIRVGMVDTLTFGCVISNIVLYISLVVILGVIIVKFSLAVAFGWFLSWKLGNFKDGQSYADRMKREQEIENWTAGIYTPANVGRSPYLYPLNPPRKKSIIPHTSRFTKPDPIKMKYGNTSELSAQNMWRRPSSATVSTIYGSTFTSPFSSTVGTNSTSPSTIYNPKDFNHSRRQSELTFPLSRRSSISVATNSPYSPFGDSKCPLPMSKHIVAQPEMTYKPFNFSLAHTICLITAYSEGIQGLRTTLDSVATTDYPNSHKLLVVICDGVITGSGNEMSTPDICLSMMRDCIVPKDEVQPYSYVAIADGAKRHNMAKVYAGFYRYDNSTVSPTQQQRVPMILIVKCGTEAEKGDKKPGNRGKRDSQIILMSFLQKVMFDERMTHLDYELFNSIWRVAGITPDKYETMLMVDADTKIFPDSLSRLMSCMVKDPDIAGLCGETKIGNKTDSWVSMMQVFEYYISHHQSKAFESIFGGVTCLPGCFCMYRIKAPKGPNGYWVPILANPDIVEHYSENVVDTLHKKNLLLLGEDRYLSTLMLKTFPKRKMVFVPQAVCKTVVPDTFSVLLSQRRRWINSTIHNLMELVLVQDLCGTFCFSMQFVVFMELVGTLALPAAISFTLYLIILACVGQPAIIPLILLAIILGLPAVLIVMTSRKLVYVGWMLIYLLSLPLWNFVLPVYAFWHFDDFTWGETRKVKGEGREVHGEKEGTFDSSQIEMRKWSEFERDRKGLEIQLDLEYREMELKEAEEAKLQQEAEKINQQDQQQALNAELAAQAALIVVANEAEQPSSPQTPTDPTPPPPPPAEESWEAMAAAGMAWSELI
ncbi:hypothetical protein INT43_008289 [Umbelopsis isabellina]|uniref:chitin synthase n=1 Tax=Mortierella isabellina TaxID=91625 RepID=A0A8H7U9B9_MORIS|nr:hypothetical protein INT43_008289 [Umbelopsis isabellina]